MLRGGGRFDWTFRWSVSVDICHCSHHSSRSRDSCPRQQQPYTLERRHISIDSNSLLCVSYNLLSA